MLSSHSISPQNLSRHLGRPGWPQVIDVRRQPAFDSDPRRLPTARRGEPEKVQEWAKALPRDRSYLVYCVHGHEVGRNTAQALRDQGLSAVFLEGGIAGWAEAGLPLLSAIWPVMAVEQAPSRWVTRERPKIDRLACPWFIKRFLDKDAEVLYVAKEKVKETVKKEGATAFDIPDVDFSHVGDHCSFDAFLKISGLSSAALARLATIVRAADTDRHDLAPEAAGLLALSLGLGQIHQSDGDLLVAGLALYDALYAWSSDLSGATHNWQPETLR